MEGAPQKMTLAQAMSRVYTKPGKYGNRKTEYNGRTFDSALEARWAQALDADRNEKDPKRRVVDVQYQVRYKLAVKKEHICTYVADFVVTFADGHTEIIDAKGVLTDVYKLKKKLMKACLGLDIREV